MIVSKTHILGCSRVSHRDLCVFQGLLRIVFSVPGSKAEGEEVLIYPCVSEVKELFKQIF